MTLKISCLKRGLVRYQLKHYWWFAVAYGLALFFVGPFVLINSKTSWLERIQDFPNLAGRFLMHSDGTYVVVLGAAVLLGVCVCRFMQTVRSATLFHAMPVTRSQLYGSTLLSGFLLLAMPLAANMLIFLSMSLWGGYEAIIPLRYVFDWFGAQLLMGTSTLCFSILMGVLCGSSVAQVILAVVVCLAPVCVLNMVSWLLDGWLFGFTPVATNEYSDFLLKILPMYYPQYLLETDRVWWISILQGVYVLLLGGLGFYAYQKRDIERAGDVVAFSWIRPLFLYGTTFGAMLAGTCFVRAMVGVDFGSVNVLFMLLFALVGYAAAKMLIQKSFRIAKYYKGYVVFAVLILLAYFAVDANIFGFGKSVPAAERIDMAYVGEYYSRHWDENQSSSGDTRRAIFFDAESLEQVRALHQTAIDSGLQGEEALEYQPIVIAYLLQNGREYVREYRVQDEAVNELMSTDAAKDSMYPIFRTRPEQIRYIELNSDDMIYDVEKEELIACVQQDLAALSYEELHGRRGDEMRQAASSMIERAEVTEIIDEKAEDEMFRYYSLCVGVRRTDGDEDDIYFEFNSNFVNTLQWIQSHGYQVH